MIRGSRIVTLDAVPLAADAAHFNNTANIGRMMVALATGEAGAASGKAVTVRRLQGHATPGNNPFYGVYVGRSPGSNLVSIAVSGFEMDVPRETTAAAVTDAQIGLKIGSPLVANPGTVTAVALNVDNGRGQIIGGNTEIGTAANPAYFTVNLP